MTSPIWLLICRGLIGEAVVGDQGVDVRKVGHCTERSSAPLGVVCDYDQSSAAGNKCPVRLGFRMFGVVRPATGSRPWTPRNKTSK